jgi:transposase
MSKGRYKRIEFKRVDWQGVRERVAGGRVVCAVDVAKTDFVATLLAADETALLTFQWEHPSQTAAVVAQLQVLAQGGVVEAVMEPSGTYGDALAWQLQRAGLGLYRVSPKRVHDAAEVYDGVPSLHDAKAAYLIGRLHLQGLSQPWPEVAAERRELLAVVSQLRMCKARQQVDLNRLEALLSRHWPESLRLLGLTSVALLALISRYGDAAAVSADVDGARTLLRRCSHGGLGDDKVTELLASAHASVGVPCVPAERALLQWLAAASQETRRQRRTLERELARRVEDRPALRQMGRAIGRVSAAVLWVVLGPPQTYPSAAGYLKAAGLNLKERSSGMHHGELALTKRGPSLARFYLYYAALRLIARDPAVQTWYARKTQRPGALPNKTVIALMRKLGGALWHVARGEAFDISKLFARQPVACA